MAARAAAASGNMIDRAHLLYREGRHEEALEFYTEAIAFAKTKAQKIALHSNRAACHLKLHDFSKAAEECTSVLELDHNHTGALMLRAQTLVTLKGYQSALFDVNRLIELNPSSDVYRNLQARLKTQLALAPIPEAEEETVEAELDEAMESEPEEAMEGEPEEAMEGEPEEAMESEPEDAALHHKLEEVAIVSDVSLSNNPEAPNDQSSKNSSDMHPKGWEAVPKPKGHSRLDYSRWDKVEDDSSEEEDEEEDSQPQYRFRVKTVGVRPVK